MPKIQCHISSAWTPVYLRACGESVSRFEAPQCRKHVSARWAVGLPSGHKDSPGTRAVADPQAQEKLSPCASVGVPRGDAACSRPGLVKRSPGIPSSPSGRRASPPVAWESYHD